MLVGACILDGSITVRLFRIGVQSSPRSWCSSCQSVRSCGTQLTGITSWDVYVYECTLLLAYYQFCGVGAEATTRLTRLDICCGNTYCEVSRWCHRAVARTVGY